MGDPTRPTEPDTDAVAAGHRAADHLGSLKTPLYETSTFVFETAEEGKRFFQLVYGLDEAEEGEEPGFIYSRLDSPNLRVAQSRLARFEGAEEALLFNSGMAAIATLFLTCLRPGDHVLYSYPVYGGTVTLLEGMLADFGITSSSFGPEATESDLEEMASNANVAMVYLETPANPTNDIFDIAMASRVAKSHAALLAVDNTFLSPIWQRPLEHGADLVIHSATKYLGGHSDLTAGVVCGSRNLLEPIRKDRYRLGTTAQPSTAWLLTRSLETLRMRVEKQTANAIEVAGFLAGHPKVAMVNHLGLLAADDPRHDLYQRQCLGPGAMISFEVVGGEEEAFRFLDAMEVVNLAVSLGGTESLASHPWTMSHSTMSAEEKKLNGVSPGLIRLSIGVESITDLIADLDNALGAI